MNKKLRDMIKDLYCVENKINIVRIPYHVRVNIDMIVKILNKLKSGRQIYISYEEYIKYVSDKIDLSAIEVIVIPMPTKRDYTEIDYITLNI